MKLGLMSPDKLLKDHWHSGRGGLISKALNCRDLNSYWGRHSWDQLFPWGAAGTTVFWPEEGCGWENAWVTEEEESWRNRALRRESMGLLRPQAMGRTWAPLPPFIPLQCIFWLHIQMPSTSRSLARDRPFCPLWAAFPSWDCVAASPCVSSTPSNLQC